MIFKNLLVFIDGTDDSRFTLELAATTADNWDAHLTVGGVIRDMIANTSVPLLISH